MSDSQRLYDLAVSDSGFLFDPHSGATFTLNSSGIVLLRGIVRGLDREQLTDELRERFELSNEDLHRDIDEFIQLLRETGLVPPDFSIAEPATPAQAVVLRAV